MKLHCVIRKDIGSVEHIAQKLINYNLVKFRAGTVSRGRDPGPESRTGSSPQTPLVRGHQRASDAPEVAASSQSSAYRTTCDARKQGFIDIRGRLPQSVGHGRGSCWPAVVILAHR